MKRPDPQNEKPRFSGHLRHYHRSSHQTQRSWDEWVDGKATRPWITQKSIKITLIVLTMLALAGIITGLVIELR